MLSDHTNNPFLKDAPPTGKVWVWEDEAWRGPLDKRGVVMEVASGKLPDEALVRDERERTFRAGDLDRRRSYDWAHGLTCLVLCIVFAGPLSLFRLLTGALDRGELRDTKNQTVRFLVVDAAFWPCLLAFAFYVASIVFAIRAYRWGRGAGFWIFMTLLALATMLSIVYFPHPMYLGKG